MSSTKSSSFPDLTEIKRQIPAEYFTASPLLSIYYMIRSAILVSLTAYALYFALSFDYVLETTALRVVVYAVYWNFQGLLFWGIFVLGHDCGHGSFSRYWWLNLIFGNVSHSFLLVPYESWRTTHRIHHKNTGNIDKDEIFYPDRTEELRFRRYVVGSMGFAWIAYLYIDVKRHFWVGEDIYKGHRTEVVISHIFWCIAVYILYQAYELFGFWMISLYYLIPLFIFMSWLVVTTFLHHQYIDSVWYGNSDWNYVKGNISATVDRSYGFGVNNLIHNIGTHQIHHLFPIIPHYKLVEATTYFQKAYPNYVLTSDENIFAAFFKYYFLYMKYGWSTTNKFTYRDHIAKKTA